MISITHSIKCFGVPSNSGTSDYYIFSALCQSSFERVYYSYMENTSTSFEDLFGVPQDGAQFESIDLQGSQNHLGSIIAYIKETRDIHTDSAQWIDDIVNELQTVQTKLRDVEVDHADKTEEIYDSVTDSMHDVLTKEADEKLFEETAKSYRHALSSIKPYVDSTILKLHAAGKLNLE